MGASSTKPPAKKEDELQSKSVRQRRENSQYTSAVNTMYISSSSSDSSISMSDDSEKVSAYSRRSLKPKAERHVVRGHAEALRALDGLTDEEKAKKSEDMLRKLWKYPHPSWSKITEITKVQTEKTSIEGQVCEDVKREVKHDVDKKIYDVPMDNCHLRLARNRTLRSCPDPWRRYGAHVKLCQIGGTIPENRGKNSRLTVIKKGTNPPIAPKTKPLWTIDDYMKIVKK